MNREKQVEEMTNFFMSLDTYDHEECENCGKWEHNCCDDGCFANKVAIDLYNTGYRKQEWISVEERLPETDNKNTYDYNVLVFIPKRDGCRQHGIYIGKIHRVKASDGKDNFWNIPTQECEWTVWGWSYFAHPVVTHWMPLPQPPKMKGGVE